MGDMSRRKTNTETLSMINTVGNSIAAQLPAQVQRRARHPIREPFTWAREARSFSAVRLLSDEPIASEASAKALFPCSAAVLSPAASSRDCHQCFVVFVGGRLFGVLK